MAIYRFQPNTPIPNNPFYYPLTDALASGGGVPLIIGAGLYVDYSTGTIESTAAINVVTRVTGILPIVVNGSLSEPVVQVEVATPSTTGVVQVGNNLEIAAGVLSVPNASTLIRGAVRLNDTTSSNATDQALTANQGRILQDQINSITAISNLTLAGTLNASTGRLATVTAAGTSKGFVAGGFLPSPVAGLTNYYVIVTVAGSYDPPGPGGSSNAVVGDWFVCDGAAWVYFAVGYVPPYATETSAGIVELATPLETETGTDNTRAVTPKGVGDMYIKNALVTGKGQLIGASGNRTPTKVDPGADGTVLTACSGCTTGLTWTVPSANYLPCSIITGKGIIVTGTAPNVAAALTLGTNGQYLTVNTATDTGLQWTTNTSIGCSFITNKGTIIVGCATNSPAPLAIGCDGCILTANSATTLGVEWAPNTAIPCSLIAGKGALIAGTCSGHPAALPLAGSDNYILRSNSLSCTGLEWVLNPYIPCCILPGKGALVVAESFHTPAALDVGLNGHYLRVNSACPLGVEWTEGCPAVAGVTSVTAGAGLTGGTITTTGTIAIAPTGVSPGTYYYASFTVGADGRITGAGTNSPVTCVTAGEGLCGGTITCMGTICLPTIAGVQGNWTAPTMTVDAKGRITAISNGSTGGVTSVSTGTGLTGGPITTTGTISLANTGVAAGTYGFGPQQYNLCVNAQGQIVSLTCTASLFAVTQASGSTENISYGFDAACDRGCRNTNLGISSGRCAASNPLNNSDNVFVGYKTGAAGCSSGMINGVGNVALGSCALYTGCCQFGTVAIGYQSMFSSTNSSCTVALGTYSARNMVGPSSCNVMVGHQSFYTPTDFCAEGVTAVGYGSLISLVGSPACAVNITAVGVQAGICASASLSNGSVFLGAVAGLCNRASCAVSLGFLAGACTSSNASISIGYTAGLCAQGERAISIGALAGQNAGEGWVSLGSQAGYLLTSTSCIDTINIGSCSGYFSPGGNNINIGTQSGNLATGQNSVAIGPYSGCRDGGCSVNIGRSTGQAFSPGYVPCFNVNVGDGAGYNSDRRFSTALGSEAGKDSSFSCNVQVGYQAGLSNRGSNEAVSIGYQAALCSCNPFSVSVGTQAGFSNANTANSCHVSVGWQANYLSGSFCGVAIGWAAGRCSQGCGTVAIGWGAGLSSDTTTTVNSSVMIGRLAGANLGGACSPIECNIYIGECAGCGSGGLWNIAIGTKAGAGVGGSNGIANILIGRCTGISSFLSGEVNNVIYIGNNITPALCAVPSGSAVVLGGPGYTYHYWGGGPGWQNLSDRSVKTDICDSALGLSFLEKIQPREFTWNYETEEVINGTRDTGVIAQEVLEAVCSTACAEHLKLVSESGGKHWVGPTSFIYPLINAVKELSAENRTLRCELTDLKSQLVALGINVQ